MLHASFTTSPKLNANHIPVVRRNRKLNICIFIFTEFHGNKAFTNQWVREGHGLYCCIFCHFWSNTIFRSYSAFPHFSEPTLFSFFYFPQIQGRSQDLRSMIDKAPRHWCSVILTISPYNITPYLYFRCLVSSLPKILLTVELDNPTAAVCPIPFLYHHQSDNNPSIFSSCQKIGLFQLFLRKKQNKTWSITPICNNLTLSTAPTVTHPLARFLACMTAELLPNT